MPSKGIVFLPGHWAALEAKPGEGGSDLSRVLFFRAKVQTSLDFPVNVCDLLNSPLFSLTVFRDKRRGTLH